MRGDAQNTKAPFRSIIRRVDEQNRLRWPGSFRDVVPWLTDAQKAPCVLYVNEHLALRVVPASDTVQIAREDLDKKMLEALKTDSLLPSAIYDLSRRLSSSWSGFITYEKAGDRYTITLPEEARSLRVVPSANEVAVLFGMERILEIWSAERWLATLKGGVLNESVIRAGIDLLE
jgi:DNA-binding transcriptional regulator/RsmH inhibitor MraZ